MTRFHVPLLPAWVRWTGVALVAVAIFVLSVVLAPPEQVVPKPEPLALDKWRHFLAYGVLSAALGYALVDREWDTRAYLAAGLGVAVTYGLSIEVVQAPLPYRFFSLGDALANALGGLLAAPLYVALRRAELRPVLERWRMVADG